LPVVALDHPSRRLRDFAHALIALIFANNATIAIYASTGNNTVFPKKMAVGNQLEN